MGVGKLVARALLDLVWPGRQQTQVMERADVFLGLIKQEMRVTPHGLRHQRLHVPGVGDDDVLGRNPSTCAARYRLDLGNIPARIVKCDGLAGDDQFLRDAADAPAWILGKEMFHLVAGAGQKKGPAPLFDGSRRRGRAS